MANIETQNDIYSNIKDLIEKSRKQTVKVVNSVMVYTHYEIDKMIVEEEQLGKERADYPKKLIKVLSERLTKEFSKGFHIEI